MNHGKKNYEKQIKLGKKGRVIIYIVHSGLWYGDR